MPVTLSRAEGRRLLVAHLGLHKMQGRGVHGTRALLQRLRCIQLDPLDVIGTNADLVVMARVENVARGDVWRHLFPRHAFEHFAKERCILPAETFPYYRTQGHEAQTPWWGHGERERRVSPELVRAVLDEVRRHGPLTARDLTDHGEVEPLDWSGWKGTARATSMALEILWTRCEIVVAGRTQSGTKIYDVPERAFGEQPLPAEEFGRWAVRERARAAGLLTRGGGGSIWSMLRRVKSSPVIDELLEAGELIEVAIEHSTRRYLAVPSFFEHKRVHYDDQVRIVGPLDPLLWDRDLVRHIFEFDYVWEVYKPESQRKWGWYVCPLLHRDRFIGRLDARIEGETLVVSKLWLETANADRTAIDAALQRHANLCGATRVRVKKTIVV
jgi:hypothetical protein